jgi:hypothetical protein
MPGDPNRIAVIFPANEEIPMNGNAHQSRERGHEHSNEEGRSFLERIEEKLDRLLGGRGDDWHEREWAPVDSPLFSYDQGDPAPRFLGGARADAPGWDPSIAGPRYDRVDVGSVGTHGVDPVSSYDGGQRPPAGSRSSARDYYLMRRLREGGHGNYADYRQRKVREFDRQFAEYCRERQERFDQEFDAWQEQRRGPPEQVAEPTRGTAGTE